MHGCNRYVNINPLVYQKLYNTFGLEWTIGGGGDLGSNKITGISRYILNITSVGIGASSTSISASICSIAFVFFCPTLGGNFIRCDLKVTPLPLVPGNFIPADSSTAAVAAKSFVTLPAKI